jgi:hypothetical protein
MVETDRGRKVATIKLHSNIQVFGEAYEEIHGEANAREREMDYGFKDLRRRERAFTKLEKNTAVEAVKDAARPIGLAPFAPGSFIGHGYHSGRCRLAMALFLG